MAKRRMLYTGLVAVTLAMGMAIGTIVSERATATQDVAQLTVPDPVQLSNVFARVAEQVGPAVVNIDVTSQTEALSLQDPFSELFPFFGNPPDLPGGEQEVFSTGSGFIVDPAGYILTNNHVIDNATAITVQLDDESEFEAEVVGIDTETDLAVIKIDAGRDLPVARMGNSDSANPGDWVLALGSPFGFARTLTAGIISAKGRRPEEVGGGTQAFQRFIQTDAAINPGNSGGPLVNMAGEVIGVNTAIISNTRQFSGVGFALPSNTAVDVYNQLVSQGRVSRGFIGITMRVDPGAIEAFGVDRGVLVDQVEPNGPSDLAGIRAGDVITTIAGMAVVDSTSLLDAVASQTVGDSVPIRVVRAGEEMTFNVEIADRETSLAARNNREPGPRFGQPNGDSQEEIGLRVREIPEQVRRLPGGRDINGVVVLQIAPDSLGDRAGLTTDMIIDRIVISGEYHEIASVDDFRNAAGAVGRAQSGTPIAFGVWILDQQDGRFNHTHLPVRIP